MELHDWGRFHVIRKKEAKRDYLFDRVFPLEDISGSDAVPPSPGAAAEDILMSRTLPILILLALAAPGSGLGRHDLDRASQPAITLGQTATFTISVDSDFANNPVGDEIGAMRLFVDASGPAPFTIGNFRIDPALPAGSTFLRTYLIERVGGHSGCPHSELAIVLYRPGL